MSKYRVFLPKSEAEKLPETVTIEEQYEAFAIISAPEDTVAELRKQYPVEKLKIEAPPSAKGAAVSFGAEMGGVPQQQRGPYRVVVRFRAPVKPAWIQKLEDAGYTVQGPLGSAAVVVIARTKVDVAKLDKFPNVEQVDQHVPSVELSPGFFEHLGMETSEEKFEEAAAKIAASEVTRVSKSNLWLPGSLIVTFFTEEDAERAKRSLRRQGIRQITPAGNDRFIVNLLGEENPFEAIQKIVVRPGLRRMEEMRIKTIHNNVARTILGDQVVTHTAHSLELTGDGETVAVADTGLDTGFAPTIHPDFYGRVDDIQDFPIAASYAHLVTNPSDQDGAADIYSGHGTHVCGSVLGNGARAEALGLEPIQGIAPEAHLVFQAIEQTPRWNLNGILYFLMNFGRQPPHHGLFGIPNDLKELFQAAYDKGARIHSNSWGGGQPGAYDAQCEDLDRFVWEHKDCLIVVAAGNDGEDTAPQGNGIDLTSVTSPATAKNCLTVGASENRRPELSATYGQWWPSDFPLAPFNSDPMADSDDDIAAFSSRGPCRTGRLKPDVVAPGTFILSTRSTQVPSNNFAWGAFTPAKRDYMFMGGTSMATPLVSGCAALVRQYLRESLEVPNPSAALIKATLIHGARYIPYRYANPASAPWADNEQGWGRVTLKEILQPDTPKQVLFIDAAEGLQTGAMYEQKVLLTDPSVPLKATMVYTDFPGSALINNLNLFVFGPDGNFFIGNDFEDRGTPDSDNNVESIMIDQPKVGTWTLRVIASEVLMGPQDFALVISGGGATLA